MLDRNRAISALMDLEKEHTKALSVIDQLKRDLTDTKRLSEDQIKQSRLERLQESSSAKVQSEMHLALTTTCQNCNAGKAAYEHLKEERDQIWRDIVKQTTLEKEEAKKRLEVWRDS